MRRIRSACCARAASGHAAAALPTSAMNSLRLMGFALRPRTKHYHTIEQELCFASQQNKTRVSALGHSLPMRLVSASHDVRSTPKADIRFQRNEPVSDIDTAVVDSLKALDPNRPIREADIA
jgi:hypothetical protein